LRIATKVNLLNPRPVTGDGLGLQHQVVFVRWGGLPEFRLMRGGIDDLLSAPE
jgi:hypothetical protein